MEKGNLVSTDGRALLAVNSDVMSAETVPSFDDPETVNVVRMQEIFEGVLLLAMFATYAVFVGMAFFQSGFGAGLFVGFFMFFALGVIIWGTETFLFKPMRFIRYGRCASRMTELAGQVGPMEKVRSWRTPQPRLIALDSARCRVLVVGPETGFSGYSLGAGNIVEAKVEREQTLVTDTRHGSRLAIFSSSGVGLISGGRSRATSKVTETAFLEIAYVTDGVSAPTRIVFPFGKERREAEDWELAIRRISQ